MTYIEPFLLGLSSSPYCFFSTAPLLIPFMFTNYNISRKQNISILAEFLLGRFVGYLLTGFILGITGTFTLKYVDPELKIILKRVAYVIAGIILFYSAYINLYTKNNKLIKHKCNKCFNWIKKSKKVFILGLVSGLSLCPPFISAMLRVFSSNLKLSGMLYFSIFFLGTNIIIIPFLFFYKIKINKIVSLISNYVMLMLGFYFFVIIGILNW